jgi:hypothetical protein
MQLEWGARPPRAQRVAPQLCSASVRRVEVEGTDGGKGAGKGENEGDPVLLLVQSSALTQREADEPITCYLVFTFLAACCR